MGLSLVGETRNERGDGGVGPELGRVEEEFPAPDQTRLLAEINDPLDEPLEDTYAQPLPDAGQARVIGQGLVQGIAEVPAMGEVEAGGLAELPLGADPFEEHHELQLEEDDRVDRGPIPVGIEFLDLGCVFKRATRAGWQRG